MYSAKSSICMYLDALICNSSKLDAGFLHKLLTKAFSLNVVIKWCMVTVGSKLQIFSAILPKHSMKVPNSSFFSCRMLTKAMEVKWWGRLVANCVPKRVSKVSKELTELGGKWCVIIFSYFLTLFVTILITD